MNTVPPESANDLRQRAEVRYKSLMPETSKTPSPGETEQLLYELRIHQIELEMQNEELRRNLAERKKVEFHIEQQMDFAKALEERTKELSAANRALAEQADFSLRIFNSTGSHMIIVNPDGVIVMVNESWQRFSRENRGKNGQTLGVGTNYFVDYDEPWGDVQNAREAFEGIRNVQCGSLPSFSLEYPCHAPDGEKRWFLLKVLPLHGEKGTVLISHTDISRFKLTEEQLATNEAHFRLLTEQVTDIVWKLDRDYRFTYISPADERLRGYRADEVIGHHVFEILTAESVALVTEKIKRRQDIELQGVHIGTESFEAQQPCRDGRIIWTEIVSTPDFDGDGELVGFHGVTRDITGRKLAEEALKKNNEKFIGLVTNIPGHVAFINATTLQYEFVNDEYEKTFGISPENIIGQHVKDIIGEVNFQYALKYIKEVRAGKSVSYENIFDLISGKRWNEVTYNPIFDDDGQVSLIAVLSYDITKRKNMEDELARQADFSTRIFNSSDAIMAIVDCNGVILDVNEAWRRFAQENMGVDESNFNVGASYFVTYDAKWGDVEQAEGAFEGIRKVQNGEMTHFSLEYPCHVSVDVQRWFLLTVLPLLGSEGSVLVSHTDITKRKCMELELRESEERFRSLFEKVHVVSLIIDLADGSIVDANSAAAEFYGWSRDELRAMNISDINVLSHEEVLKEMEAARTEQRKHFHFFHRRADGSIRAVEVYSGFINYCGKSILYSVVHDITERKQAEQKLNDAMNYIQTIFNTSPVGILTYKSNGDALSANDAMARIVGTSVENLLKQNFRDISSWQRSGLLEVAECTLISGAEQRNDFHLITSYGKEVDVDCLFLPFMYNGEQHLMFMAMDITDRKQVEDALMQEKAFLRALIDAASDYIYFKDRNGFYLGCNKSSQNLIGLSEQEQIGKSDIDIFSKEEAEHILKKDQEILKSGVAIRIEEWVSSSTVGRVLLETTKAPIFDNHGQPIGLLGISRDITERKHMEEDLLQAKAAAESANHAKSEFLANMSHELRNPMNGVLGMTQLLEMTELTQDQREFVGALKLSGKNLLSLINDILDLSKIEAGKITIEPVEFSLRHCFNDVALMQKSVIFAKGLTLELEVSEDIPQFMMGDQLRVKQILHNLLGNAVKFTSQGGITISVQLLERQDASLLVEVAVRDSGIGISPEALDKIFLPFEQENGSTTRTYGGTGLGLTISRSLTELMGGSIAVASTPGEGSCFKVTLPFTAVIERVVPNETPQKAKVSWDGPPLRILLVENDQVNIIFGTALFKKLGFYVTVAQNSRECITVLENGGLDIVLMDINMPDMNGEEALREIRRNEQDTSRHQMVIALTAYSLRGDKERFLQEGFDGYVSKPMDIVELIDEMKRVVVKGEGLWV